MSFPSSRSVSQSRQQSINPRRRAPQMSQQMVSTAPAQQAWRQIYPTTRSAIPECKEVIVILTLAQELFSKLRFSYVEQVTKEKFIRAIVGDPPLIVEHQENIKLEQQLLVIKKSLKAQKNDVAEMVADLERRGQELARKYETIQLQTTQLRELPEKIENLEASIEELKEAQAPGPNPELHLPLEKTLALLARKEKEQAKLDRELEQLRAEMPRKTRELERLEAEMQPLEVRRLGSTASAREAKRRKEEALGGVGDDLEARGRWWRGVESGLKVMLGVEN